MSIALALAATAAMSGTSFVCTLDTAYLTVFAPSEEETANFRGNVLTLYKVSGDGEIFPTAPRIRQVFDILPDSLRISVTTGEDIEIELELSDYDPVAKSAGITLAAQSSSESLGTLKGTCVSSSVNGQQTQ